MLKRLLPYVIFPLAAVLAVSCVPKRHLVSAQDNIRRLQNDSTQFENRISNLQRDLKNLEGNRASLQQQLEATRNEASNQLQDASKKLNMSQQQIADQQKKLEQLQALIEQQRKNTQELRNKINNALTGFNADELTVSTKNGKVYVSLQENLLFPSGSAIVNPKGKQALSKLAGVLNVNPDINVEIEGHTDSIPIRGRYADNWDLSVARSTAIVRILTATYNVDPTRVTASGRNRYDPVDTNLTPEGRAKNRRTEIILEPKLDELMQLIQSDSSSTPGQ